MDISSDEKFMKLAIDQARLSLDRREFPVGAILVRNNEVIGTAFNRDRELGYLAHAEMLLLLEADQKKPKFSERKEMTLYTTLEPCLMCMGAAVSFFVGEIVYSLDAPEDGGARLANIQFGGSSIKEYKLPPLKKGILMEETRELIRHYISVGENKSLIEYSKKLLSAST
jgi:tRNA(adenine34) deaminase